MVSLYVGVFEFSYRIETQNTEVIGTSHCLCNGSVIAWHLQKTIMYAAENGVKLKGVSLQYIKHMLVTGGMGIFLLLGKTSTKGFTGLQK
jgi:hypothetical protein